MRTMIVAISATLALLAAGVPAHANFESFADEAGDARPKIDIRSVKVDNDRDRVRILIKVQNLQPDAYESWRVWIDTPRAGVPNYLVGLDQHSTFGETNGWRLKPNGQDPWGNVNCSNGGKRLFKRDIVRFSFKATYFEVHWLPYREVEINTMRTHRSNYNAGLDDTFGDVAVAKIAAPQIQRWVTAQKKAGVKPGTIRARYRTLATVLGALTGVSAVRDGLIPASPCVDLLPAQGGRADGRARRVVASDPAAGRRVRASWPQPRDSSTGEEHETYTMLFNLLQKVLPKPAALIYLHASPHSSCAGPAKWQACRAGHAARVPASPAAPLRQLGRRLS